MHTLYFSLLALGVRLSHVQATTATRPMSSTAWTSPAPWAAWTASSWTAWTAPSWTAWTAQSECYGPWTCWEPGTCSVTCGEGVTVEKRTRERLDCATSDCNGPLEEQRSATCNIPGCACDEDVGEWTVWAGVSPCSATCSGYMTQNRYRECTVPTGCSWDLIQSRQMPCSHPCW
ncbi:adhesion G protein-coupled receptor B3-like [Haliotis rufescens]|uniref:adhesion G protein-coupled receptor B3-like n=1 Tax=Haliotis rufescens TaxID=6454 RepID=UPI00201F08E3|nr:adhesion G protein-coupled receptor B3-like [Haliotis rufescens]